jgi:WXXGXW repeat (2 copies)
MSIRTAIHAMLFAVVVATLSATSFAQVGVAITIAPPPLPVYEQPVCPGDGYIWTPGYWAYDADFDDYYWVPGTWVMAPEAGFLWTPPYWGWNGAGFVFYDGYWGPQIGFYGGINYGFGYFGTGFVGGRWDNGHFFYNRAVTNVNETNIRNVYVENVTNTTVNHVSYNGGNGGITARPTAQQEAYARATHTPPVQAQQQQIEAARGNRDLRASVNQGKPSIAATAKAGDFKGNVVAAQEAGGTYHPPANGVRAAGANNERAPAQNNPRTTEDNARPAENNERGAETNTTRPPESNSARQAIHPNDLPTAERPPAPNTGNPKLDQKYQKQQDKMMAQQTKERQKLQKQQDKDHAQQQKQQANEAKQQQLEQKHQQQTSHLQQRQAQQMQQMQKKQQPAMHAQAAPAKAAPERKPPQQ